MERFQNYIKIYLFSLPGFLLSLIWPIFDPLYLIIFVAASFNLLFSSQRAQVDPQHSTFTHHQRASRTNWLNYAISAYLIVASLILAYSPISRNITTFMVWSVLALLIHFFAKRAVIFLNIEIITDYLHQQLPSVSKPKMEKLVHNLLRHPDMNIEEIRKESGLDPVNASVLLKLFNTYLDTNYQKYEPIPTTNT